MQWLFVILAVLLSLGAGYWVYRADKKRAVPYPWITSLLRTLVVFLTLLLLVMPAITISRNEVQKPVVLFLQDDSRSIAQALKADTTTYRKNAEALLAKLSDKYRVVKWGFGNTVTADSLYHYKQSATDIATALSRAQEFYGQQNLGAIILATDGHFNEGANPQYQSLSLHNPVYTVALGDSAAEKDLRITQVYANKRVSLNSQFEIRGDMVATLCKGYQNDVRLQEVDGSILGNSALNIISDRYDHSVSFTVKAEKAGLHHYIISVPVADGEQNVANNRRDVFVEVVDEKKNILIVSAAPHPDVNAIKEALSSLEGYTITVKTIDNFPASLSEYNVIVLHGLPSVNSNIVPQLQAAKKPTWYILSSQTGVANIAALQKPATLNISQGQLQDQFATLNTAFTGFTLPQKTQAVMDKMPPLGMLSGNIQAMPDAMVLFRQRNNATQPVWMLKQGAVPTAMLAGEGIWRWRLYEYRQFGQHTVVDECIRQTVSFLCATNEKPFRVELPKYVWSDQESITLNAYLLNANNEQVNTPEAQLAITDSAGRKQNYSLERAGNAYRINIGVWAGGTYTYTAHVNYDGKEHAVNGSFVVESVPLELMETGADYSLLYGLAKKYSGAFVPAKNISYLYDSISHNTSIKPVIQTNTETVPLVDWKWFFFLILAIAVGEWLLRKYWLAQ
ncbi:MAG: hypothetical protein WCG87_00320 [Bacteroidota bacterium]